MAVGQHRVRYTGHCADNNDVFPPNPQLPILAARLIFTIKTIHDHIFGILSFYCLVDSNISFHRNNGNSHSITYISKNRLYKHV